MRFILIAVTLALVSPALISCTKQDGEQIKELEEKVEALEKKTEQKPAVAAKPAPKPAEKKETSKLQERIKSNLEVMKEKKSKTGWVRLYDKKGFADRTVTVRFGRNVADMHKVKTNDGQVGFNDKTSSARYNVPEGWKAILYQDIKFGATGYTLTGKGSVSDLGPFADRTSSLRWEEIK